MSQTFSDWLGDVDAVEAAFDSLEASQQSVHALNDSLRRSTGQGAIFSARLLGMFGRDAAAAIPSLLHACTHPDARMRVSAVWALGMIRGEADSIVPVLAELLTDHAVEVRREAASAIAWFGQDATPAIYHLAMALSDSDTQVRCAAIRALFVMHDQVGLILSAIVQQLKVADDEEKCLLLQLIANSGETGRWAIPALVQCLNRYSSKVHDAARAALEAIDADLLVDELDALVAQRRQITKRLHEVLT